MLKYWTKQWSYQMEAGNICYRHGSKIANDGPKLRGMISGEKDGNICCSAPPDLCLESSQSQMGLGNF